ncbi:hypothetical protein ACE14D_16365, partial [Streptomyces sp. Act-28]
MSAHGSLTLSGPRWVAVRQHRTALRVTAWLLGAALAVTAALRWWAVTSRDEAACAAGDWLNCEDRIFQGYGTPSELLRLAMERGSLGLLLLPALVGAFVAGPLVARELESGTHRLAWTQSVSPTRWFATKVGPPPPNQKPPPPPHTPRHLHTTPPQQGPQNIDKNP